MRALICFLLSTYFAVVSISSAAAGPVTVSERGSLPIDVALHVRGHRTRSAVVFSPDGRWIAHTIETADFLPSSALFYSATGVPLAEGRARMEAHLTDTRTGEDVRIGSPTSSSWGASWAPDGKRVAFYSDEGGSAGLWIWEMSTRRAVRFSGLIVRPFFGFEPPRWSSDGRTLLCKVLPENMTIAEANALTPVPQTQRRFPAHAEDAVSVQVLRTEADQKTFKSDKVSAFTQRSSADLALLNIETGRVQRIARRQRILWYGFSPDQRYVAYTDIDGDSQQEAEIFYGIELVDRRSGQIRPLAQHVPMDYGVELNWSPDSRSLALTEHDKQAVVSLSVLPIDGSARRPLFQSAAVSLKETAPHWTADGRQLYAAAVGGHLWRVDALSGAGSAVEAPAGTQIRTLISKSEKPIVWTTANGRYLWAIGIRLDQHQPSILRIDAATGRAQPEGLLSGEVGGGSSIDASDAGDRIAFISSDQHHPTDLWVFNARNRQAHQLSHLNPELERYELGDTKVISFSTADGKKLHAALLLPPHFQIGHPLSTVVWVYGGENGSEAVYRFGLWGDTPVFNMQILATRGYAVLFPDTPLGKGAPVKDLLKTVMPAVDAAIADGYADPDRLAVMGQSFGAYTVLSLITHTNRFKAAVVSASVINPDLLASYLEMADDGSPRWIGYFEHGQIGLGGTPWQYRSQYIENSPIYDFDKITTPLLMAQGADDGRLIGPDATFIALRRLGKDVEYRVYEGEGHVLQRPANVRDFWQRRLDFLQTNLLGANRLSTTASPSK